MCRRLADLGATVDQVDAVRRMWPTSNERDRLVLIAAADQTLEAAIAEANAADHFHEVDVVDEAQSELIREAGTLVATWGPAQLLRDWVKDEPDRAAALLVVERAGRNRTSLVRVLEEIAGRAA